MERAELALGNKRTRLRARIALGRKASAAAARRLVTAHPDPGWAQACFSVGPLSAAFWTLVYSQWSSARAWQRMGRLHERRRDRGGLLVTVAKATAWMFLAVFGSFLCVPDRFPARTVCDIRRHSPAPALVRSVPVGVLFPAVRHVGLEASPCLKRSCASTRAGSGE